MPNRIIREGINSSPRVDLLKWDEEVFYRRLHSVVDDYGRCEADLKYLRARCFPLRTDSVRVADMTRFIAACVRAGLILEYAVNGKRYIQVQDFRQQTRTPSKHPAPLENVEVVKPLSDINCNHLAANAHLGVSVVVSGGGVVKQPRANNSARMEFFGCVAAGEVWKELYRKEFHKEPHVGRRDLNTLKRIIPACPTESQFRTVAKAYLEDKDDWLLRNGHPLWKLEHTINVYLPSPELNMSFDPTENPADEQP